MALLAALYGDSVFVQTKPPGGYNAWGVKQPGPPLQFQYVSADYGAGHIACQGKRVCGASMTADGIFRTAVPAAMDMPNALNMIVQDANSRAKYLEETCTSIHKHTTTLAEHVNEAELALDVLTKGVEASGVQEIQSRLDALKQKIPELEAAVQKEAAAQQCLRKNLGEQTREIDHLAITVKQQKETLAASAGAELMTAKDRLTLEAKLAGLESRLDSRLRQVDKQLMKKCECAVM